jgi:hypothetical protein
MLICDNAIREEGPGKVSLIGIFANIYALALPAVHSSLCVYANLGDAQGKYRFRLEMMQADAMRIIGRGEAEIEVVDRMKPAEIVFELRGLTVPDVMNSTFTRMIVGLVESRSTC